MTIINEEKIYQDLKESIRMMNNQWSTEKFNLILKKYTEKDTEKINLIEEGKKTGVDEIIKHNGVINNNLKPEI